MLDSLWDNISGWLGNSLSSILESILNATIFKLCYYIEKGLCWIVSILTQLFEVFAGLQRVTYNHQKPDYLINILFSNRAISNIYMGMAIIGMVMLIVFTIWSVIKKMADISGRQQQSMGEIIGSAVKSFFLILSMTLIMNVVLSFTNVLMEQVNFIFNNAYHLDQPVTREFSEEEYAAMGRVLSTVGNYSIVQTSSNRYNLNLCYNDIRPDMYYLQQQGVFEYSYYTTDKNGNLVDSWQSVLSRIAKSVDLTLDAKVDIYDQNIASSITYAMDYLQTTSNPVPLKSISQTYVADNNVHLDRLLFLMGTTGAAKNSTFNKAPRIDDALRGPYYYNQGRSIYNFRHVDQDFDIGFSTDYIVVWMLAIALIFDLVVIMLNCITRMFNMLFLYLIAPPVIAASPLDGGGKFKQWMTAFIVQSFSVFATVISMRLLTIYLPIVISPQLVLFEKHATLNMFAKFVLVFGGFEAAKKSTGLLTGILADSAGWQSIQAGDMSGVASQTVGRVGSAVSGAAGVAKGVAGRVAGNMKAAGAFAIKPLTNAVSTPFKNVAEKWSQLGTGGRQEKQRQDAIQQKIAQGKAEQAYAQAHPDEAQYLGIQNRNSSSQNSQSNQNNQVNQNQNNQNSQNNQNNQNNRDNRNQNQNQNQNPNAQANRPGAIPPPNVPNRAGRSNEAPAVGGAGARSLDNFRAQRGLGGAGGAAPGGMPGGGAGGGAGAQGGGAAGGAQNAPVNPPPRAPRAKNGPVDLPTSNRPTLDK